MPAGARCESRPRLSESDEEFFIYPFQFFSWHHLVEREAQRAAAGRDGHAQRSEIQRLMANHEVRR